MNLDAQKVERELRDELAGKYINGSLYMWLRISNTCICYSTRKKYIKLKLMNTCTHQIIVIFYD